MTSADRDAAGAHPNVVERRRSSWPVRIALLLAGALAGGAGVIVTLWLADTRMVPAARIIPDRPPVRVILGEQFLTALVRRAFAEAVVDPRLAIRNVFVDAQPGVLVVGGTTDLFGRPTAVHVVLRPTVSDGILRMRVVSGEFARLPLPLPLGRILQRELNVRLDSLLAGLPGVISSIAVDRDEGLVVTGRIALDQLEWALARPPPP